MPEANIGDLAANAAAILKQRAKGHPRA